MDTTFSLARRDSTSSVTVDLIIVLLVLLIVSILSVAALWFLRRKRRQREASLLPIHKNMDQNLSPKYKGHRRVSGISISKKAPYSAQQGSQPNFVDAEKQEFLASTSPPPSAEKLPQICITFPEETDSAGKRLSGRSVLIHVDEKGGVGMEPMNEEDLPPYEAGRFVSLDLDRLGGLKEKENMHPPSATT